MVSETTEPASPRIVRSRRRARKLARVGRKLFKPLVPFRGNPSDYKPELVRWLEFEAL